MDTGGYGVGGFEVWRLWVPPLYIPPPINVCLYFAVVVETTRPALEQYVPQLNELIGRLTHCRISKTILWPKLKVSKISTSESLVGEDVLVRVSIPVSCQSDLFDWGIVGVFLVQIGIHCWYTTIPS